MSDRVEREPGAGRLPWVVAPWVQPFWYAYLGFSWWQVGAREAARSGLGGDRPVEHALVTWLLPLAKLAVWLLEAGFYRLLWRSRGRTLPFWRFVLVIVSVSLADVLAYHLGEIARETTSLAPWLAPLAGLAALPDWASESSGVRTVFGGVGLLTLIRIGLTGWAQARGVSVSWRAGVLWTGLVWLLCRLALLWSVDLMRGMSPLPAR